MRILAMDTTSERLTLALGDGSRVHFLADRPAKAQDERLNAAVEKLLEKAGMGLEQVDAFAAASGPGRFTGIRVGLTFIGVLGKMFGKPALSISWLEAAAFRAAENGAAGKFVVALKGPRDEIFFQAFRVSAAGVTPASRPAFADEKGFRPALHRHCRGSKAVFGPEAPGVLDAARLLPPALSRLARGQPGEFAPLYLKPAHYER